MSADLLSLLSSRRSVRRFSPEPVSEAALRELIEAAVLAPSASNKQPWRFFVVTSRTTIDAMAEAVRDAVERIARAVPAGSEEAFRAYGDYFVRFAAAPAVIVPICRGPAILSHLASGPLDDAERARIAFDLAQVRRIDVDPRAADPVEEERVRLAEAEHLLLDAILLAPTERHARALAQLRGERLAREDVRAQAAAADTNFGSQAEPSPR